MTQQYHPQSPEIPVHVEGVVHVHINDLFEHLCCYCSHVQPGIPNMVDESFVWGTCAQVGQYYNTCSLEAHYIIL